MTLANRPIFAVEEMAIAPRLGFNRLLLSVLGSTMAIGFVFPVALAQYLPKSFKTALLGAGLVSSIGVAAMTRKTGDDEAVASTITEARRHQLRIHLEQQIARQAIAGEIQGETQALELIMRLPEWQQIYYLQKYGLLPLAAPLYPELQQAPQPQGAIASAQPTTNTLHDFDAEMVKWQSQQDEAQGSTAPQLYAKTIRQCMIWAGSSGEGKTVAAHYALWLWATDDRDLVIYVFDMHFGMGHGKTDERYRSNWLGLPLAEKIPRHIKSCVYKGRPTDLEAFINPVIDLVRYRIENEINSPDVVVVVDEFTNILSEFEEDEVERISNAYSRFATEAKKYGVYIWFCQHSLSKVDLGGEKKPFPRKVMRQCELAMGAKMTQDKIQVSNAPVTLPAEAIATAQAYYRQHGSPAGFATSLPIEGGWLPPAPVSDLRDLRLDWVTVNATAEQQAEAQKEAEPQAKVEGGNLYKAIAIWIAEIGRQPTIEETREQIKAINGSEPSDEAIAYLLKNLDRLSGI